MKELTEYRKKLVSRLEQAAEEFRRECLRVSDPHLLLRDSRWTVHQIAAHTRDVHGLVYGLRARRTAEEQNPAFLSFDGEAYMAEHYQVSEPLETLLDTFMASVQALVELLEALPVEAWSRVSRHQTLGSGLTLQTWVERDLAHIEEHLKAVRQHRTPGLE